MSQRAYSRQVSRLRRTATDAPESKVRQNPSADGVLVPTTSRVNTEATVNDLELDYDDETREQLLVAVENTTLPVSIQTIVEDDKVLGDRELFTWKWIYHIFGEMLTLPTVPSEHRQTAQEAKFLSGTYITLMDDLAEKHGDTETFWELAKVVYPATEPDWSHPHIRDDYAEAVKSVWTALEKRLESAPRYEEFREAFLFDMRSAVQGMDFARLSGNHPGFDNRTETWKYETAAIGMYATVGSDLLFSPEFDPNDYDGFRELMAELQRMWRLGNWAITWQREVKEHDFTAGVIVEALEQGVVSESDLEQLEAGNIPPEAIIERIESAGIGKQYLADWKRRRDRLRQRDFRLDSIDSNVLIRKMEQLMMSHLATEGNR